MRLLLCAVFVLFVFCSHDTGHAADGVRRPIQALLVTGGCCHDYERQKVILTRGISARADVRWTIVHQGGTTTDTAIPLYDDPHWADGFDIVVHNECFADVKDTDFVDRILAPHKNGTPAILIHCAMHCYRVPDDRWFRFVGLQSPGHGPHYSYSAENLQPQHPVMKGFGAQFIAPQGELYHAVKVFDTATPLAQANRQSDGNPQVCVWTNQYHGTRVFGTTIGHYSETMAEPKYLDLLTRGLLWATQRDPDADFRPSTASVDESIRALVSDSAATSELPGGCCGENNLAFERPVSASSEQPGNLKQYLTDGDLTTRWCASGPQLDESVTVDLGQPQDVRQIRLHWEKKEGTAYQYVVESSLDQEHWELVTDQFENRDKGGVRTHDVSAKQTRYLKITYLGATTRGLWASLWEVEATAGVLPDLAKINQDKNAPSVDDVTVPEGFDVRIFGTPPAVNYPVCLTAAATGEIFVGVDEQGSLGKEPGRGKVLRCIDTDGDGMADDVREFARMDHPRGLVFEQGGGTPQDPDTLWVLHPPYLSVYRDHDGDGVADSSEVLIEGISTEQVNERGADHTTNGIRRGIDGWIYIAVGDFGFTKAVARKDGTTLSRRGGGVVRIRPDGTEMEIFSWGQRNILDVAIDPEMNMFTRDNTNDGGGWDIRLSHVMQSANYGYPSLYINFPNEIMPPLADYGGGSGCGSMFFQDTRWPQPYDRLLLTCDWGTNDVFSHQLPRSGATFEAQQSPFIRVPRPTDIDVDGSGRMYVSSWKNGRFAYDGPNVGFVAQILPRGFVPRPIPDVRSLSPAEQVRLLNHPAAVVREHVQRTILRMTDDSERMEVTDELRRLVRDQTLPQAARVAALYTDKQLNGADANAFLNGLLDDAALAEHAIRALSDRMTQQQGADVAAVVAALNHPQPRIRAAAVIAVARLLQDRKDVSESERAKRSQVATKLLQLTHSPSSPRPEGDAWRLPDPDRVIPHLAIQSLVRLELIEDCLQAVSGAYRNGALQALQMLHRTKTVDGLFQLLSTTRDNPGRQDLWSALIRLYHREGDYTGGWWGTRPDTTGPYFDRQTWEQSDRIATALQVGINDADPETREYLLQQLKRHVVAIEGITEDANAEMARETAIAVPPVDANDPHQIGNLSFDEVARRATAVPGDAAVGRRLFQAQSCNQCHTVANGQTPRGPHLVDIGRRYSKAELIESIVTPARKIAQGFDTWTFVMVNGRVHTGFVVLESAESVTIRQTDGRSLELLQDDIDERVKQETSMMPNGIVGNLTPEQLADLIAWLQTLK